MIRFSETRRRLLDFSNGISLAMSKPAFYCWLGLYWSFFLAPLLLASMSRPFPWWDYLTLPGVFHYGLPASWENLIPGYLQSLRNSYIVRPTTSLMWDLQLLTIHGQVWLWYVLKWLAKGSAIFLVVRILRTRGANWPISATIAAFLLFHTTSFQLMLSAPDGLVALGAVTLICLAMPANRPPFDLAGMGWPRYSLFLLVFFLTLGVKEVAYAFCGVMTVALAICGGWRSIPRLVPLGSLMLLWTWMFAQAGGRTKGLSVATLMRDTSTHMVMLVPSSPFGLLKGAIILLCCYALWLALRKAADRALILLCFVAAFGTLLFTSTTGFAAARYTIPAIYLLTIPVGLALRSLNPPKLVLAGFLLIYPLLTAGDLFKQELAYNQLLFECGEVINLLEAKAASGYQISLSGENEDIGLEYQNTVRFLFDHYGPRFYGTPRLATHSIAQQGLPDGRFAFLSSLPPERITRRFPNLSWRLEGTQRATRGYYGVLEVMTAYFNTLDNWTGNQHVPRYDNGAPTVTPVPIFYVHTFAAREAAQPPGLIANPLQGQPLHYISNAAAPRIWRIPIGSGAQAKLLVYSGEIEVQKGSVAFGIVTSAGAPVWSVPLGPTRVSQQLPAVPDAVEFGPGETYHLYFAAKEQPSEFMLREFKMSKPVEVGTIPRLRRYGAVMP